MNFTVVLKNDGRPTVDIDSFLVGPKAVQVTRMPLAQMPLQEPLVNVILGVSGPNIIQIRGDISGQYAFLMTDTCAICTNGQANINSKWSLTNGQSVLVGGRAYNVGASSDYNQNVEQTFALFVGESNSALNGGLDYVQFFRLNETRHTLRIKRDGEIGWGDGATTESDVMLVHNAADQLTVQIGVAHANALRVAEAAASETAMLLRVNRAGVFSLDRVTIGANDSGGAGFKCLRVPN